MTPRMQAYQFMTQKQQDILDYNDLWDQMNEMVDQMNEMVSEVSITNESEWDSFWNEALEAALLIKDPWMIIE